MADAQISVSRKREDRGAEVGVAWGFGVRLSNGSGRCIVWERAVPLNKISFNFLAGEVHSGVYSDMNIQFTRPIAGKKINETRNSSGDEIAIVNFLYDDIVHALKYNRLLHKFRHRSQIATQVYQIQWISADGQRTEWCRNIAEDFNRLSRAHERYRQTTDYRQTDGR